MVFLALMRGVLQPIWFTQVEEPEMKRYRDQQSVDGQVSVGKMGSVGKVGVRRHRVGDPGGHEWRVMQLHNWKDQISFFVESYFFFLLS